MNDERKVGMSGGFSLQRTGTKTKRSNMLCNQVTHLRTLLLGATRFLSNGVRTRALLDQQRHAALHLFVHAP